MKAGVDARGATVGPGPPRSSLDGPLPGLTFGGGGAMNTLPPSPRGPGFYLPRKNLRSADQKLPSFPLRRWRRRSSRRDRFCFCVGFPFGSFTPSPRNDGCVEGTRRGRRVALYETFSNLSLTCLTPHPIHEPFFDRGVVDRTAPDLRCLPEGNRGSMCGKVRDVWIKRKRFEPPTLFFSLFRNPSPSLFHTSRSFLGEREGKRFRSDLRTMGCGCERKRSTYLATSSGPRRVDDEPTPSPFLALFRQGVGRGSSNDGKRKAREEKRRRDFSRTNPHLGGLDRWNDWTTAVEDKGSV